MMKIEIEIPQTDSEQLTAEEKALATSIPARFRQVVASVPDSHLAYVDAKESLTYQELDQRSNHLAAVLIEQLGERDVTDKRMPVALLLPHESVSLIGILGTLKAGYFHVPLDEDQGEVVLQHIVNDCTPQALVTTSALHHLASKLLGENHQIPILCVDALPLGTFAPPVMVESNPQAYVCIQYTSGSTGLPRGIIRTQIQNLQASYFAYQDLGYCPSDRVAHLFSYAHAGTTRVLFGSLLNGATIYAQKVKEVSPLALYEWVQQVQITQLYISVGVMRGLGDLPEEYPLLASIRAIYTLGEAVQRQDIERLWRLLPADCRVVSTLSATEANTFARFILHPAMPWEGDRLPAGYPPTSVEVTILDENGQSLPPNSMGEIAVRSRYLCAGYWNQPELTAAKFLPDPDGGDCPIFLTGDMGCMKPDGLLEHLGRKDFMVKIRGYRVELEAIESELRKLQTIQDGVVTTQELSTGGQRLVAYVMPRAKDKITTSDLRAQLAASLPDYMIPSLFVMMKALPMTVGGKVDRKALPPPGAERPELSVPYVAPRNELEEQIGDIWAELLQIAPVGVEDNFFEMGGDSLLATRMALQVERRLRQSLPSDFFRKPTVAHLVSLYPSDSVPLDTTATKQAGPDRPPATNTKYGSYASLYPSLNLSLPDAKTRGETKAPTGSTHIHRLLTGQAGPKYYLVQAARKFVAHLSYRRACRWLAWWAGQEQVVNTLYRTDYDRLQRMMEELNAINGTPRQAFQLSLSNYLIAKFVARKTSMPLSLQNLSQTQASPYRFWRNLAQGIEQAILEPEKSAIASVSGFSHVEEAYRQGRGVILLSYHTYWGYMSNTILARRLQIDEIWTLSETFATQRYKRAQRNSAHSPLPVSRAAYIAEVTGRAQQHLHNGNIIQIVNDQSFDATNTLPVSIGRRLYNLKPGFAELALNTGAAIIPLYTTRDLTGQIHTKIHAPLEAENCHASRAQQVQSLTNQWAKFLETSWRLYPESLTWPVGLKHLGQPLA